MRVLVLSDVHANLEAALACLDAAPAYDVAVSLGDLVGYGASPNEVIERIRPLCTLHVRGNHDKAVAGVTGLEGFNPIAALAAHWTRQNVTPANLEWLRGVPAGPIQVEGCARYRLGPRLPLGEDEYMVAIRDAMESLLRTRTQITFFGHSHIQGGFFLDGEFCTEIIPDTEPGDTRDTADLRLLDNVKYLINPGSVGQPRDGDWRAAFALFDSDRRVVTFHRVPYDVSTAQERIRDAELPERLAARLATGR